MLYRFILLAFCCSFAFIACKKEDVQKLPPPDQNGYVLLRDITSLPLIKQTLRGNWEIHYQYGGFTGNQITKLNNSWYRYLPNDSMYIIFEGKTYAATKPNFVRKQTQFGFTAWVLDFGFINAWQLRDELVIDTMKNDTIGLVRNAPDSYGYYMTRYQ